ncbi:MAG: DUF2271 domain-containing protein, partial [Candidatus Acidiferrales bacterium]
MSRGAAKYSTFFVVAMILLLVPGQSESSSISPHFKRYDFHYENVLGTSLEVKVLADSAASSEKAEQTVLAKIERERRILSSWDPNSEFSRWFRTEDRPVKVSPDLYEVLSLFDKWRGLTHGALDASAETVTRVWQHAAAENRLPTKEELDAAVVRVHEIHWRLDPVNHTATHTSDVPLAMNSFVKSFIAGRAADAALRTSGVQGLVVNIGGDLVVRGDWQERVDVADPKSDAENGAPIARLVVQNRAVATSGDYRRGVEIGGRHYSHIVDPRTGMTADEIISSTVIARAPEVAGALATALSVLSPEEGARLISTLPGVEYLLVKKDGERIESGGWSAFFAPPEQRNYRWQTVALHKGVADKSPSGLWNPRYELDITIDLSLIPGFRVKRPYVAVWIEDENHDPVRTISLWFRKYKFLNELRAWTRAEDMRT